MKKLHFRAVMAVFAAFLMIFMTACSGKEMSLDTIDPSAYVTLPEYKGLKIEKIDVSVSEGDIEAAVMNDLDGFGEEKDVDDRPVLDGAKCISCQKCAKVCPTKAITMVTVGTNAKGKEIKHPEIDSSKCVSCENCVINCPKAALKIEEVL